MRDPDRIDPLLHALGDLWKTVPDQRFGQLIMNLCRNEQGGFNDPWGWEESTWHDKIAEAVETFAKADAETEELIQKLRDALG